MRWVALWLFGVLDFAGLPVDLVLLRGWYNIRFLDFVCLVAGCGVGLVLFMLVGGDVAGLEWFCVLCCGLGLLLGGCCFLDLRCLLRYVFCWGLRVRGLLVPGVYVWLV